MSGKDMSHHPEKTFPLTKGSSLCPWGIVSSVDFTMNYRMPCVIIQVEKFMAFESG